MLILANVLGIFLLLLRLFRLCCLLAAPLGRLGRGNVLVFRGLYIAESGWHGEAGAWGAARCAA